jgi:hypothetical protein
VLRLVERRKLEVGGKVALSLAFYCVLNREPRDWVDARTRGLTQNKQ